MFKRTIRDLSAKPRRSARLGFEELEDRSVPHTGVVQFGIPTAGAGAAGIVFAPDGAFWFTENATDKIGRVTKDGHFTEFAVPGAGSGPLHITVGPDGALWFTENNSDQIGRIDLSGNVTEFAVPGAGSMPNDIAAGPDGALWFTETGSDQIGRITTAGVVTEFAVPGVGSAPGGITAGPDNALWFTEAGSGQIGRIDLAGGIIEYTIPVPNAAAFSDPEDIVAGPAGSLYFTDFGRDQIGRITTSGEITQFNLPIGRGPNQITVAADGNLYFTESASSRIGRLPSNALAPGRPTSGNPPLEEFDFIARDSVPLGITMDANNDIWFTLNSANSVATFASHLQQITVATTGPLVSVYDINLNQVRSFFPFPGYTGALNVTVEDLGGALGPGGTLGFGNGIPDAIVTPAGPGNLPIVAIFDGSDNRLLGAFFAFTPLYKGGISLAAGDVNGDGRADLVVAAGPFVKVIDGTKLGMIGPDYQIADGALLASFLAFPLGSVSSVSLAVGDMTRDGFADIVIGAGPGALPIVLALDGTKLNQRQSNFLIAPSALLGAFFAFTPVYTGGVNVSIAFDASQDDIVVGAATGIPAVRLVDGKKLNQRLANGEIAPGALLATFFAFSPFLPVGVRVAADDLNNDGQAELIISAGPGALPVVRIVDGAKTGLLQATGEISPAALLANFPTVNFPFTGGVNIAADADHRDGTIFGPPGINQPGAQANSRVDINDMYIFKSPVNPNNTVLAMDVSPFSSTGTPAAFVPGVYYDFRVVNRDLVNATDDLAFRMTFGPPDAAAGGRQDVTVRALPAARFAGSGGVVVKGFTGQNTAVRTAGGGQFRAAEQDDPFFFDSSTFSKFLNGGGLSDGSNADNAAGKYPSGTSNGGTGNPGGLGFGPGQTPDYNGHNFFANANTLSIILELPSAILAGKPVGTPLVADQNAVGFWGRTEVGGVQVDRMGRPAINTALIPAVPRGSNFPADGSALNRIDVRNAFNAGVPRDDRANFGAGMSAVLAAVYPIGGNGQAPIVANLLLPDILVYDPTSSAGFFQDTVGTFGQPDFFLAGGRKLTDDIISTELAVLTDPDTPFNPAQQPLVTTQNVADDNGLSITDGTVVGPGNPMAGMTRAAMFPYFAPPNPNPSDVPGGNPPP